MRNLLKDTGEGGKNPFEKARPWMRAVIAVISVMLLQCLLYATHTQCFRGDPVAGCVLGVRVMLLVFLPDPRIDKLQGTMFHASRSSSYVICCGIAG